MSPFRLPKWLLSDEAVRPSGSLKSRLAADTVAADYEWKSETDQARISY